MLSLVHKWSRTLHHLFVACIYGYVHWNLNIGCQQFKTHEKVCFRHWINLIFQNMTTTHPSSKTILHMATKSAKQDTLVPSNMCFATKILGPSIFVIKGKHNIQSKETAITRDPVPLSNSIEDLPYIDLTCVTDVLYASQTSSWSWNQKSRSAQWSSPCTQCK